MDFLKPQSPLKDNKTDNFIYPVTTSDQVILGDGSRISDYSIIKNEEVIMTLSASDWVEDNGQYLQTINIKELSEEFNASAKVIYTGDLDTDILISESASCVSYAVQNKKSITFCCLKNKPVVDIPIEVVMYL